MKNVMFIYLFKLLPKLSNFINSNDCNEKSHQNKNRCDFKQI